MSDQQIKQSLVDEFISDRLSQYERHFNSPLWKKSLQPYLKALYEIANRNVLQGKDHMTIDVQRGMALAFENILNLPKFVDHLIGEKTNPSAATSPAQLNGPITDYADDFRELFIEDKD